MTRIWWPRVLVALTLVAAGFNVAPTAAGAQASLSVSPANGLDPNGAFVVVSGTGFVPNSQLFVMQCRSTSTDDHVCNSVGLRKVTTDASGAFTANAMRVVSRFGATDCLVGSCSIMTSAVSGHSGDRSQDRAAGISFAAPAPAPTEPAPTPEPGPAPTSAPATPAPSPTAPAPDGGGATPSTTAAPAVDESTTTVETTTADTDEAASAAVEDEPQPSDVADADSREEGDADGGDDAALALSADTGDDDGGSSAPQIVGGVALLAALGAGAVLAVKRRGVSS